MVFAWTKEYPRTRRGTTCARDGFRIVMHGLGQGIGLRTGVVGVYFECDAAGAAQNRGGK